MSVQTDSAYITIKAFGSLSGLGQTSIYEALRRGDLRAIRVGRRTLIDTQHALAWLSRQPSWVPAYPVATRNSGR